MLADQIGDGFEGYILGSMSSGMLHWCFTLCSGGVPADEFGWDGDRMMVGWGWGWVAPMLEGMRLGVDLGSWWRSRGLDSGCIFKKLGHGLARMHGLWIWWRTGWALE